MMLENDSDYGNDIQFEITEFEDMKIIWDSQNEEKLYAINESALYKQVKRKAVSVSRTLQRFEFIMVSVNLFVAGALTVVALVNDSDAFEYLLPLIYLAYALIFFAWRRGRRQDDTHFEATMLGELDKAIWQINYLIRRTRELILWYLTPLTIFMGATILYQGEPFFALALVVVMVAAGLTSDRWEIKRCYMPKKHALESLRETLLAAES